VTPLVSVCIPAYRAAPYIGQSIESVLGQTMSDFELLVVDDASPDGTYEIARAYERDGRVRVHRNAENLGAAANWNHVVALASGRYVKLLCSDDSLMPTCLERQVDAFESAEGVALVSCKRNVIDERDRPIFEAWGLTGIEGRHTGDAVVRRVVRSGRNLVGEPSSVLISKDVLDRVGAYAIDLDMWCRVLRHGDFVGIAETLATFRVGSSSWSATLARRQASQHRRLIRRVHAARPDLITRTDVLMGVSTATALSFGRRLAFARVALSRRWRERGGPVALPEGTPG
jgi:glycosyltransferase involved in cell wall biosynthesis